MSIGYLYVADSDGVFHQTLRFIKSRLPVCGIFFVLVGGEFIWSRVVYAQSLTQSLSWISPVEIVSHIFCLHDDINSCSDCATLSIHHKVSFYCHVCRLLQSSENTSTRPHFSCSLYSHLLYGNNCCKFTITIIFYAYFIQSVIIIICIVIFPFF